MCLEIVFYVFKNVKNNSKINFIHTMLLHCATGGLNPIPHKKIYMKIHSQIQIATRKVASTKQFVKVQVHFSGGREGRFHPSCFGIGFY